MIKNYYDYVKDKKQKKVCGLNLPFYALLIGNSGSGKTTILLSILENLSGQFQRICICLKSKEEPLYRLLERKVKQIEFFENEIPDLDTFKDYESSFIAFDDFILENKKIQDQMASYFIRARKLNCSVCLLSQSYYRISKLIRQNAQYIFVRKISTISDLKLILREYSLTYDLDELINLYNESTKVFPSFMLIDVINNNICSGFSEQ